MTQPNKRARGKHLLRHPHAGWLLWFAVVIVAGPVAWVALYGVINPPPTLAMVIKSDRPIERAWTPIGKISPGLVDALIGAEDNGFCTHHGFQRSAVGAAWRGNQPGRTLKGADTITAQTVRTLFLWSNRTWLRDALETYFTVLTEHLWPKSRIMEVYLNTVEWGDGIYGAQAAAKFYFQTDAAHLTMAESARLVAVLPNARRWSPLTDAPLIVYRAVATEQRGAEVRADGKSLCVLPPP